MDDLEHAPRSLGVAAIAAVLLLAAIIAITAAYAATPDQRTRDEAVYAASDLDGCESMAALVNFDDADLCLDWF